MPRDDPQRIRPEPTMVWLSVHAVTPTVIRLWPLVVRFLLGTLADLYVFAASPNAIQLPRKRLTFLRNALTDLPAMAAERIDRPIKPYPPHR